MKLFIIHYLLSYCIRRDQNSTYKTGLTDRQQYVALGGFQSSKQTMTCGTPQGSTLGPLLFLIYRVSQKKLTPLLFIWISNVSVFFDSPCTGCIKKKETFRNQAYCKNLNAFSIAHMLNRAWCVKYWWSAYIRKRRPLEINHCYNLNPGALC
jgi:hypothetical protein